MIEMLDKAATMKSYSWLLSKIGRICLEDPSYEICFSRKTLLYLSDTLRNETRTNDKAVLLPKPWSYGRRDIAAHSSSCRNPVTGFIGRSGISSGLFMYLAFSCTLGMCYWRISAKSNSELCGSKMFKLLFPLLPGSRMFGSRTLMPTQTNSETGFVLKNDPGTKTCEPDEIDSRWFEWWMLNLSRSLSPSSLDNSGFAYKYNVANLHRAPSTLRPTRVRTGRLESPKLVMGPCFWSRGAISERPPRENVECTEMDVCAICKGLAQNLNCCIVLLQFRPNLRDFLCSLQVESRSVEIFFCQ